MTLSFYIIAGPTAIGKSKFAINLAKKINGNIINADSMQVYKDLEILTARPSNQDTKIIDHHLYGYVRANERYNVEKWCNDARDKIIESQKNNVVPPRRNNVASYQKTTKKNFGPQTGLS